METYSITLTSDNADTKVLERQIEIPSLAFSVEPIPNQNYTGKYIHPIPNVSFMGNLLEKDVDYKLEYKNDTNVGTATVIITGLGDYSVINPAEINFKILEVSVTDVLLPNIPITLNVGDSLTLSERIFPTNASNKAVTWKSSDNSIAVVDSNGKVTAKKAGTITITVTTVDGNKTADCEIKVVASVDSVSLPETITLRVGTAMTLTASILPIEANNKAVTWSSNNRNVAVIDENGKITALKAGTATITVTTADGKKKAECKVIVE
jgi:hypothetical protein